jgi:hypothetical protein
MGVAGSSGSERYCRPIPGARRTVATARNAPSFDFVLRNVQPSLSRVWENSTWSDALNGPGVWPYEQHVMLDWSAPVDLPAVRIPVFTRDRAISELPVGVQRTTSVPPWPKALSQHSTRDEAPARTQWVLVA